MTCPSQQQLKLCIRKIASVLLIKRLPVAGGKLTYGRGTSSQMRQDDHDAALSRTSFLLDRINHLKGQHSMVPALD